MPSVLDLADILQLIIDGLDVPDASDKNHRVFPQILSLILGHSAAGWGEGILYATCLTLPHLKTALPCPFWPDVAPARVFCCNTQHTSLAAIQWCSRSAKEKQQ
jgi:hypothetical protein